MLGPGLCSLLGAVGMAAELIGKIVYLTERQRMLIVQIVVSADRATEILDQLLDVTRARFGSGLHVLREQMDIAFVSRQLVEEMRSLHPNRTFTLKISGDTTGHWDKPRMGQVFSNLLGNAVQYGFTDRPIDVTIIGDSKEVSLSVHNEGVPIPKDAIGGIFEAMIRGGTEGIDSTNLGLGLYITKEIVSAHGGTIRVTSSEKDGTTFIALLPRVVDAAIVAEDGIQPARSHQKAVG